MCVFCVIEATDRSDCQYTKNKMEIQQRNIVHNTKTQTILIRSSPYSPRLRLRSNFQWWPCFIVSSSREITIQGLNVSSPEANFAWKGGYWILQATWSTQTLLLPTSFVTFSSIVERANLDSQSRRIPLWDGLNLQALWCSMLPLVSSTLCLLLLYFTILCVQSSSQGSLFHFLCLSTSV